MCKCEFVCFLCAFYVFSHFFLHFLLVPAHFGPTFVSFFLFFLPFPLTFSLFPSLFLTSHFPSKWIDIPSTHIVPGDLIELAAGSVIAADIRIEHIDHILEVDLSALTGEAFPRHREVGDEVLAGCVVRSGSAMARVMRTGAMSAMGKSVSLVARVETKNRLS